MPATPILFCSHVVELGGAEMVLLDLLGELDRSQFTPHLAVPGDGPLAAGAAERGVELHEVPLAGNSKLGKVRAIWRSAGPLAELARQMDCHLLVANSMIAGYAAGLALNRNPELALVWHLHTVTRSKIARAGLRRAHTVIAPSRAGLDAPGLTNGTHIHNGVPDRFFAPPAPQAGATMRAQHGVPEGVALLGIIGRLDPHKGHDALLASLAQDWPSGAAPHLAIVGGELFADAHARLGGYADHLRREVTRLGLQARVHWLGEVDDTAPLLPQLDALVVPSTGTESAPRTIAEAQAAGCPVIASAVGGIPEMLQHGEAGLLAGTGTSTELVVGLRRALADDAWRAKAVHNARQYAETHYRMAAFARRCETVFAQASTAARS